MSTLLCIHGEQILPVEGNAALCHLVGRIAHYDIRKGGLACTVGTHECMDFAITNGQVDSLEYFFVAHFGVKILYF